MRTSSRWPPGGFRTENLFQTKMSMPFWQDTSCGSPCPQVFRPKKAFSAKDRRLERVNDLAHAFSPQRARPHESIRWALAARSLRADTLPQRGTPKESLMMMSMTEALITITVGELLRTIELDLKDRLERFLRSGHRHAWWMQLDTRVRRNAENRRKWTVAETGA